jgi:hypothetical protein
MNSNDSDAPITADPAAFFDNRPRIVGKVTLAEAYAACGLPCPLHAEISTPEIPAPSALKSEIPVPLQSQISNPEIQAAPASSVQHPDAETEEDSLTAPIVPLAGLEPLSNEGHTMYRAFMLFLTSQPISIREFARRNGLERRTIHRWKIRFRWNDRICRYNSAHLASQAAKSLPIPADQSPSAPDESRALQCNFKAKALSIALSAMERWRTSDDVPVTLPGIVRMLELALKLTGQAASSTTNDIEESPGFAQLMKSMEKVYGPEAMAAANTKPVQQ